MYKAPGCGSGNDNEWGQRLAEMLGRLMRADFTAIPDCYDRAATLEYPGGVQALSYDGADQFWMGLRASFPNAAFKIHHVIGRDDPMMPPRAAVRWTLHGTHDGWGTFGYQQVRMFLFWGRPMRNMEPWLRASQNFAANGLYLMKQRSGNKSCCKPAFRRQGHD